ncbi:magnesium transport protein CorA, partial [Haematococcus lacustris]
MSWDVIKELALRYDLHPLAVEDMIHVPQRIKADFYDNFLYMSLTLVGLQPSAAAATAPELAAWDEWAQQTTHAERILRVDEMQAPR